MTQKVLNSIRVAAGSRAGLVILSTMALVAPSAFAAPIVGTLALSANGTTVIAVNGTKIDFNFIGTVSNTFPPVATSGTVTGNNADALYDVGASSTGSFATVIGSTTTVHDLDSTLEPTGSLVGPSLPLLTSSPLPRSPSGISPSRKSFPGSSRPRAATALLPVPPAHWRVHLSI